MALIIAFGHKARTGKDAAVKAIIDQRGKDLDIRRYAFADAMKNEVTAEVANCGGSVPDFIRRLKQLEESRYSAPDGYSASPAVMALNPDEPLDYSDPLCPYGKHRGLLQYWGGDYRRGDNPFYWVDKVDRQILEDKPTVALISDMRYLNEALMVKHYNGFTVQVKREGGGLAGAHGSHLSEAQLDKYGYDFTIVSEQNNLPMLQSDAVELFDLIAKHVDLERAEDFNFEINETNSDRPQAA